MSEQDREYWLAGGDDLAKVKLFIAERDAAIKAVDALGKKYGADYTLTTRGFLSAVTFPDDVAPEGWKRLGRELIGGKYRPYFFPSSKTKALKAIRADMGSVRIKGAAEFSSLMGVAPAMRASGLGMSIIYASWEFISDDLLISIPLAGGEASTWTPSGSRRLAMSEYWAMKEAALSKVEA